MRKVHGLHHVNIETSKLEETRKFYEDFAGLTVGPRPRLAFPGYWMYFEDQPVLHLIEIADNPGMPNARVNRIDHWACMAEGYEETLALVKERGHLYREADIGDDHLKRLFVKDPNGCVLELAFLMDKATGKELKSKPANWYSGATIYELDPEAKERLERFKQKDMVPAE